MTDDHRPLVCALCIHAGRHEFEQGGRVTKDPKDAITFVNGTAVCREHAHELTPR